MDAGQYLGQELMRTGEEAEGSHLRPLQGEGGDNGLDRSPERMRTGPPALEDLSSSP